MSLHFSKMHGAGNDFVLIDARRGPVHLDANVVSAMADRHRGIGFDQLLLLESTDAPDCLAGYRIWNADGSPAGQCGNGARCVVAWLHRSGELAIGEQAQLRSPSGTIAVCLHAPDSVSVNMGNPRFEPQCIPFDTAAQALAYPIEVTQDTFEIGALSMGNPHAVLEVESVESARLVQLGPALSGHPRFPEGCNAGFAEVITADHIRLRVHERGAGWTLACGSGACAAVAALQMQGRVGRHVQVSLPGGTLVIDWQGPGHPMWMQGPAAFVFDGEWLSN